MVATTDTDSLARDPGIIVPLHSAPECGNRSPSGLYCRRAKGHTGRHAFIRHHITPGLVREVWDADCQVCQRPTRDGAVCRECGA